ncbi:hypothetical protein [Glutamicibacter nicotianae]|uniref:hypothetical protein n=1 Tax=Glutamicibacter nicotianae TaxID=37929 RepID=UPI00167FCEF1|nr:hypothetical protein [Glutamicibacter nicotianae]
MAEIIIYGASDDLVEIEGAIREEFDIYEPSTVVLESPGGEFMRVDIQYRREWEINVGSMTDVLTPSWPIRFGERPDNEDDPAIIIDAPEGTTVRMENK